MPILILTRCQNLQRAATVAAQHFVASQLCEKVTART